MSWTRDLLAKTPVKYTAPSKLFSGIGNRTNNPTSQLGSTGSNSTLFAVIHNLANATAAINWRLYRKSSTGNPEDRTEVLSHPALVVFNKPNQFYTRQEFVETFQQHIDLAGEAWWVVSYIGNTPIELWPVRPDKMTPVPHPTDFLSGYIYNGPEGEKIPLGLNEVIQIRMPNPLDPYRGMGPIQSLLVDLDSTKYAAEWNRNYFYNSAEPGGVIEVPNGLSDSQFDELQARWNEQHRGVSGAHRVAIIEHGTWKDRNVSQKDMQFAELRQVSRDIIQEAFGFPKSMLGTVTDVNRANAEAMEYVFAKWRIVPRLERIKMALNNDFLPLFGATGQGVEFDYENPVPDDEAQEIADRNSIVANLVALKNAGFDETAAAEWLGITPIPLTSQPVSVGGGTNGGSN